MLSRVVLLSALVAGCRAFITRGEKHFDGTYPKDDTDKQNDDYYDADKRNNDYYDADKQNDDYADYDADKEQKQEKADLAKTLYYLEMSEGHHQVKRSLPEVRRPLPEVVLSLPDMTSPIFSQPQALHDIPPGHPPLEAPILPDEAPGTPDETAQPEEDAILPSLQAAADEALMGMFPGQFLTSTQVEQIATYEITRKRRALDRDICCRTDIWFGTAPTRLPCVDGGDPLTILKGDDVFQAYARGDCHQHAPHQSCPTNGSCKQKTRLHTLWVKDGNDANLKYFRINSHCAYEMDHV